MRVAQGILAGSGSVLLLLTLSSCNQTPPPGVAAMVNSKPITYTEVDRQYQTLFGMPPKAGDDQVTLQKLEVLRGLIDNEIMLQRAEKLSLLATDSEVDAKFNELKAPYTQEELARLLKERNLTQEELKAQLRRDESVKRLFNREITSKISISDKEIADFYNSNKAMFNLTEPQIHMAQILVTPQADPTVQNLKGDKAKNAEEARKKMEMIKRRLDNNEDFSRVAQNYSEDTNSAQQGGDLGFIPESALEKTSPELRKLLLATPPGQLTPVVATSEGYRLFKIISREPAGQRELNDPKVQQNIRETLLNRKDQLLKNAYYEVARNEAKVTNYLALSIAPNTTAK